jgi:hypothetical protein
MNLFTYLYVVGSLELALAALHLITDIPTV